MKEVMINLGIPKEEYLLMYDEYKQQIKRIMSYNPLNYSKPRISKDLARDAYLY